MTDLFDNMPPPDMTLERAKQIITGLRTRIEYIDHDLEHKASQLTRDRKWGLQQERYDKKKRLAEIEDWIERGLI